MLPCLYPARRLCQWFAALLTILLLVLRAGAQEEQIADGSRRFAGGYPGASLAVFDSVLNAQRLQVFDFAALRFYVAPLFVLEAAAPLNPILTPQGNLLYGFKLVAFTEQSRTDAARNLSQTITDSRSGQLVTISPANVYDLPHQLVQFRVIRLPEALVNTKGSSLDQNVAYFPNEVLTIEVPESRREFFESLIRAGLLQVEAILTYNAKSVSRVQLTISETAVLRAARQRVFDGQGAAYFSADDLEQIVREAVTSTEISFYADAEADAQMLATVTSFLDSLRAQSYAALVESLNDARNLEAKLWEGPGIQPADYQPITLLWNVTRNLATVDDYRVANESVREYYDENRESFSVSFRAGWGPFSATIRKGFDRISINQEFFSNQEELNQFKQENLKENGQEPRITARGLGLVSSRDLESRVGAFSKVVSYKPQDRISQVVLQCLLVYQGSDSTDILSMLDIQRRLAALEKQEIKSTSISFSSDTQTEFDVLVTPYQPAHAKRPITQPLHSGLVASHVTAASVERSNNGRRRGVELTIKWPRPFPVGTAVNAFAALRLLDVDGNGGSENTRVDVSVASADHTGLVVSVETWEGTYLYGVALWVVAYSSADHETMQSLFPLDAAASEIGASTARQQVYNLYRPEVLLSGIQTSPSLQHQHGLYPLASAAANILASPNLMEIYGFKQRIVELVRGSAVEMAAAGLYPESAIRNLHAEAPLIAIDPATGRATLEFGLEYSDTLQPGSWQPFGDTVLWEDQPRPDHAFYRVFLKEQP